MKSLVVLLALVSLTVAAPALPGMGLANTYRTPHWHTQPQSNFAEFLKRERKSPSEIFNPAFNSEAQNVQHMDSGVSTPMARSFALKKPLIVKKKNGYRLYRDSEEEKANADSQESCGRQVKVKLCDEDGKFRKPMKGSENERDELHTSEDDVKHSIKMAKEAVENLQRDLKKMEQKPDMKMAHDSEADTELHEDIEVARQALEHIHENFGNLESMSLHATASRDSEPVQDVHLTIAKTEEERLAQWKEAIENIQKNFEVVKNIEDSFKTAGTQESLIDLDQPESAAIENGHNLEEKVKLHEPLTEVNHMRAEENTETHNKPTNDHLGKHITEGEPNAEEDMKSAASEMIETHIDNNKNQMPLISESHKKHEHEKSAEGTVEELNVHPGEKDNKAIISLPENREKSSETTMDMLTDQSEHHMSPVSSMKVDEEGSQPTLEFEKHAAFKTSEKSPDAPKDFHGDTHMTPINGVKPLNLDTLGEQQRTAEHKTGEDKIEKHQNQEKDAVDDMTASDDMIDFMAKSAEPLNHHHHEMKTEHSPQEHVMELGKAAETAKPEHVERLTEDWDMQAKEAVHNPLTGTKNEENLHHIPKSAEKLELTHLQGVPEQPENVMLAKSADHISILDHQKQHNVEQEEPTHAETVPAMKAAEEHLNHLKNLHNAHWNPDKQLDHLSSMKAAEEFNKDFEMNPGHNMDHLRNSHNMAEHSHMAGNIGVSNDFELSSHGRPHHHFPQRHHHNQMAHSNFHDMNSMGSHMNANYHHPGMRDATEGFGSDQMFRWKPNHESARVAYGSSGLPSPIGSTGAVGVFPNANTGGCGIPLLLSCSPSVVSGSLAKAHSTGPSSYSTVPASSYRTEDDFAFHNKRDIKKTSDIRTTNILRTPTIMKQKSQMLLDNKM